MRPRVCWFIALLALALTSTSSARSDDAFLFSEGQHQQGELRYVNGLPVMTLQGTPEEMGRQHAALLFKSVKGLVDEPKRILREHGVELAWPLVVAVAQQAMKNIPVDHRRELDAAVEASGVEEEVLIVANAMLELRRIGGCSTFVAGPSRSKSGGPLFGRNLDFPPLGDYYKYTLVIVYRPKGKRSFASVTFPGMGGVYSGINDAGLSVATHDVYQSKDGARKFDPKGTPLSFCYRRILEECATVAEAEKLMRTMKPTTLSNLAVCDTKQSAVFELTPMTVAVRQAENDILRCTNHFRTEELTTSQSCSRFSALEKHGDDEGRLSVHDVTGIMHEVNQRDWTIQSMVFEPAALRLHLAFGKGPATAGPYKSLDLTRLLGKK